MTLVIVCGATASGKSALALDVAERIGAEIINADSMQLYRGMDIGTAKLPVHQRRGIPHHLLDLLSVREDANVAWYQERARAIIDSGKNFVVVGGTGLYIKSIVDNLNFPDTDPELRERLTQEADELGAVAMHQRLAERDPVAALAIPVENIRRVVRALEVIELTGAPYTANLPRKEEMRYPHAFHFGLEIDREQLNDRINARVETMWEAGFVDEVQFLKNEGLCEGRTAQRALGYAQILRYLDVEISESDAKEETKVATRQYARRQDTWFKRDERITWLSPEINRCEAILAAIE